ncbi:MAG: N-acetylmuramoyl-L-alanine amidase [Kiritimatiellae bacterium]|nr:N-acetylmuramoyl-L-alanine amidase [Kiritimatiellia bacterium]
MIFTSILFALLSIAFPREGVKFQHLDKIYVIGAVDRGVKEVYLNGKSVSVYRIGAWAGMVDVQPGLNEITVTSKLEKVSRSFYVANPPSTNGQKVVQKKYEKLPYASDEPQVVPTNKTPASITIYLDAGHGGHDSGAVSPHSYPEKQVNLFVAKEIKKSLDSLGYNVILTRTNDVFIALQDRPKMAHETKADAFISIHHNAPAHNHNAATTRYASVYAWNDIGKVLGEAIRTSFEEAVKDEISVRGVFSANFKVMRSPQVPSCLVEIDFVTHPAGEAASWNVDRRRKVGAAIARGIDNWCKGQ